mgnify:CR=1 FL=1
MPSLVPELSEATRRNLEAYERMKRELLERHRGKVVAIVDGQLVGVYEDEDAALRDVVERFGLVPMLIKRVEEERPIQVPPSYAYGLMQVKL